MTTRIQRSISGAAVVLLAALAFGGTAQAAHRPPPPIDLAKQIAANYWGVEQTCPAEAVSIVWTPDLGDSPDTGGGPAGGRAIIGGCTTGELTIWLNSSINVGFAVRCTTVVHEYGHLIGLGHTTDASVMNPLWAAWHPLRPCIAAQKHWRQRHWR